MTRLLAVALLGLSSAAWAAEPRPIRDMNIPDARLSDAEQFGHFTDVSRPQSERVVAPSFSGSWTPRPEAAAAVPLARPRMAVPEPQGMFVPLQNLPPLETPEDKPRGGNVGLWTLGAVGMGLALVALGVSGPRRRAEQPAPEAPRPKRRGAVLQEELAPIEPWSPVARVAPFGPITPPKAEPAAEPRVGAAEFAPALPDASWYAITAAEQRAIDQWDRSPEKRLGIASLTEWLYRHETRLPDIDVPLLRRKLTRDA